MNKLEQAARQAQIAISDAVNALLFLARDCEMRNSAIDTGNTAITALREALSEQAKQAEIPEWVDIDDYEEQAEQEPFDMDDHPPHRLCECRKCMEYFTPLPDCDAFAASGKPIAEQTNTQLMEGFRPVSEMIAEHKQDPKKAAAIEKAKMRKAEQEPVAIIEKEAGFETEVYITGYADSLPDGVFKLYAAPVQQAEQEPVAWMYDDGTSHKFIEPVLSVKRKDFPDGWREVPLYAAPVRTKDLTDDEIYTLYSEPCSDREMLEFARAVIAADREKNK